MNLHITVLERSEVSKIGLQEKIVMEDWYSEKPSSVNLARRKCTKSEKADRTKPTKPIHFILDFKIDFPSFILLYNGRGFKKRERESVRKVKRESLAMIRVKNMV
ncbi:hypothetical protein F3Y22_tig00112281pilonHSYRG00348 [Hibiscus syriacus]|uniref:Uncharacterized protein n=1 Tax=Hibiscus syriacus TaxID=106335 RepID=A0A6A2YAB9_HIBSY|nr:hypothetical protein F3Y22_tig00112281pilonHSYRG00348 [Hibiscus syriacus]